MNLKNIINRISKQKLVLIGLMSLTLLGTDFSPYPTFDTVSKAIQNGISKMSPNGSLTIFFDTSMKGFTYGNYFEIGPGHDIIRINPTTTIRTLDDQLVRSPAVSNLGLLGGMLQHEGFHYWCTTTNCDLNMSIYSPKAGAILLASAGAEWFSVQELGSYHNEFIFQTLAIDDALASSNPLNAYDIYLAQGNSWTGWITAYNGAATELKNLSAQTDRLIVDLALSPKDGLDFTYRIGSQDLISITGDAAIREMTGTNGTREQVEAFFKTKTAQSQLINYIKQKINKTLKAIEILKPDTVAMKSITDKNFYKIQSYISSHAGATSSGGRSGSNPFYGIGVTTGLWSPIQGYGANSTIVSSREVSITAGDSTSYSRQYLINTNGNLRSFNCRGGLCREWIETDKATGDGYFISSLFVDPQGIASNSSGITIIDNKVINKDTLLPVDPPKEVPISISNFSGTDDINLFVDNSTGKITGAVGITENASSGSSVVTDYNTTGGGINKTTIPKLGIYMAPNADGGYSVMMPYGAGLVGPNGATHAPGLKYSPVGTCLNCSSGFGAQVIWQNPDSTAPGGIPISSPSPVASPSNSPVDNSGSVGGNVDFGGGRFDGGSFEGNNGGDSFYGGGGGGCFVAGTKITMADGSLKSIETIFPGDLVTTYDELNKQTISSKVTKLHHHAAEKRLLYTFKMQDGSVFTATDVHPLYVPELNTYLEVKEIVKDKISGKKISLLRALDRRPIKIYSVEYHQISIPVYNFEVQGLIDDRAKEQQDPYGLGHNYVAAGYVAHNAVYGIDIMALLLKTTMHKASAEEAYVRKFSVPRDSGRKTTLSNKPVTNLPSPKIFDLKVTPTKPKKISIK